MGQFTTDEKPAGLESLIAARHRTSPDDPALPVWDAEAKAPPLANTELFLALAETVGGEPAKAQAHLAQLLEEDDYNVDDLYADPDLAPALRSPAFRPWREKHADPTTEPADG